VSIAGSRFVRAPAHLAPFVRDDPPVDLDELAERLGDNVVQHSGTAWLTYCEPSSAQLTDTVDVVSIPDDDPRLARLERRARVDEWVQASAGEPCTTRVGIVDGPELVAVASLHAWDDAIGHIGVYTHHDARGHGLAARVASAIVVDSFERGLVPQWRANVDNHTSVAVAARLGFAAAGHQIFVRVRPAPR
jgi:predicted GNAT family acetyltransferase